MESFNGLMFEIALEKKGRIYQCSVDLENVSKENNMTRLLING